MTHNPLLRQLFGFPPETTPPSPLRPLPTATHVSAVRLLDGRLAYRIPPRPSLGLRLTDAQAQARTLRRRPLQLQRPQLHHDHDHPRLPALIELAASYVLGEAAGVDLVPPSPWERYRLGAHLDQLAGSIEDHRWGARFRLADVRTFLDTSL